MANYEYYKLDNEHISQEVISKFACNHPDFDEYLHNHATVAADNGEGVTYVLVDEQEYKNKSVTKVLAFATIQSTSLHYYLNGSSEKSIANTPEIDSRLYNLPCIEIMYFAIDKAFQNTVAATIDRDKHYSTIFFEWLLQDLYEMSCKIVGFQAIFLRANEKGYGLYSRKKFTDCSNYIIPYEDSDAGSRCTPMLLLIAQHIEDIFGE